MSALVIAVTVGRMWRHIVTRVRELDPLVGDALLAAAFALAGVIESMFVKSGGHSRPLTAVAAAAVAVPLVWRRRHTLASVVAFSVVLAVVWQANTLFIEKLAAPFIAVLLLAYTAGRHEPSRRMWPELVVLAVEVAAVGGIRSLGDIVWTVVLLGGPALAGRGIRSRVLLQREMHDKAQRLEAERDLRARRAVEDERARIAAELQAVVANGLSAMVVQAEAVPRLFGTGQTATAAQALEVIEETGRDALAEMRRLLGVLRRDDEGPALAPQPTLARADALVTRMQGEGLTAAVTVEGEQVPLSPGVDLAGYRVLQEALASATKAEGVSRTDVSIVYGNDNVLIKVRDDRATSDGLDPEVMRALRERVGLYGGVLRTVSRQSGDGFEVEARLPIGGPR
jgi:signal transduction histidine kinase